MVERIAKILYLRGLSPAEIRGMLSDFAVNYSSILEKIYPWLIIGYIIATIIFFITWK